MIGFGSLAGGAAVEGSVLMPSLPWALRSIIDHNTGQRVGVRATRELVRGGPSRSRTSDFRPTTRYNAATERLIRGFLRESCRRSRRSRERRFRKSSLESRVAPRALLKPHFSYFLFTIRILAAPAVACREAASLRIFPKPGLWRGLQRCGHASLT